MEPLEQFKTVRNEMRKYLENVLVDYMDAVDDSEFDKADEIRYNLLPYSHMFYVMQLDKYGWLNNERYKHYDGYQFIRWKQEPEITRFDIFMENHLKSKITDFDPVIVDNKNKYKVI